MKMIKHADGSYFAGYSNKAVGSKYPAEFVMPIPGEQKAYEEKAMRPLVYTSDRHCERMVHLLNGHGYDVRAVELKEVA